MTQGKLPAKPCRCCYKLSQAKSRGHFEVDQHMKTTSDLQIGAAASPELPELHELPAIHEAEASPAPAPQTTASSGRSRRVWALALGTAAVWQMDPALGEMAEMVAMIACTANKSLAKDAIFEMRAKADTLRAQIAPLPASALSKVIRRAEAACGAVLDKGVRVKEVQTSWDMFLACVRAPRDPKP